ncbi:hypothetical protein CSAL01_02619 [Colletotrichum salicis]|uniref:FAD dependent oxidoreductase domain-containing protein n=1 Tax=Colletotrichum salicis TaxID=1209931 RepID=A0A135UC38_9PEZI|nr:hypothetical protein CSAL01_02619 [Colletotrichum salicis]
MVDKFSINKCFHKYRAAFPAGCVKTSIGCGAAQSGNLMRARLIVPFALCLASKALGKDPGLPAANPTISYWQLPPLEGVADHQSEHLPRDVDVVIVDSGMSGTSIAWHLLKDDSSTTPLRVAMIEARQAYSGATGRNGGHIRPSSYAEYAGAKLAVSQSEAAKITRLRSAHVNALISAANSLPEDGRLAAEARVVDNITIGSPTGTPQMAGAIWPYRFITHALKSLLGTYPGFTLDTNTAALNISTTAEAADPFNFELGGSGLPKAGEWPSYTGTGSSVGGRAWSLYRNGLDYYIVQMPQNGELMFGADIDGDDANANTYDDSRPSLHLSASYLNGALPNHSGYDTWGSERTDFPPPSDKRVWDGRTKRLGVGIEGGSIDSRPFVGRIPQSITGQSMKNASVGSEWVRMISNAGSGATVNNDSAVIPEWLPESFLVTGERLAKRNVTKRQVRQWMHPRMAKVLIWD